MTSKPQTAVNSENAQLLEQFSHKYVKSGYKLPRREIDEVARTLTAALRAGGGLEDHALRFAVSLPPESLARALKESWGELPDELRQKVVAGLQLIRESRGWRLRLAVTVALREVDRSTARRVLMDVCRTMLDKVHGRPRKEAITVFRQSLLDGDRAAVLDVDITNPTQAEIAPFLTCLSASGFGEGSERTKGATTQQQLFQWIVDNDLFRRLGDVDKERVEAAVRSWPADAITHFRQSLKTAGIRIGEVPVAAVSTRDSAEPLTQAASSAPDSFTPRVEGSVAAGERLHAKALLGQLARAVTQLETDSTALRKQIQELREKRTTNENEKRKLTDELLTLREQLLKSEEEVAGLRSAARQLESANASLDQKVAKQAEKLEAAARLHKAEAEQMARLITVESRRAVEAFQNKLADELKRYRRSYEDVRTNPMNDELGEALRRHIAETFAALEREGVQTKL